MNYDGEDSGGVRAWAIENAAMWVRDFHVDGLRLDATHALFDGSPTHVLAELAERVKAENLGALVISEMGSATCARSATGATTHSGSTTFTTRCTFS